MPYYEYRGERYFLQYNMIQCMNCKEVIETRMVNHFVTCNCRCVSITGGLESPGLYYGHARDVSIWKTKDGKTLPPDIVETMFKHEP